MLSTPLDLRRIADASHRGHFKAQLWLFGEIRNPSLPCKNGEQPPPSGLSLRKRPKKLIGCFSFHAISPALFVHHLSRMLFVSPDYAGTKNWPEAGDMLTKRFKNKMNALHDARASGSSDETRATSACVTTAASVQGQIVVVDQKAFIPAWHVCASALKRSLPPTRGAWSCKACHDARHTKAGQHRHQTVTQNEGEATLALRNIRGWCAALLQNNSLRCRTCCLPTGLILRVCSLRGSMPTSTTLRIFPA